MRSATRRAARSAITPAMASAAKAIPTNARDPPRRRGEAGREAARVEGDEHRAVHRALAVAGAARSPRSRFGFENTKRVLAPASCALERHRRARPRRRRGAGGRPARRARWRRRRASARPRRRGGHALGPVLHHRLRQGALERLGERVGARLDEVPLRRGVLALQDDAGRDRHERDGQEDERDAARGAGGRERHVPEGYRGAEGRGRAALRRAARRRAGAKRSRLSAPPRTPPRSPP